MNKQELFYEVLSAIRRRERCTDCTKIGVCKLYPYWDKEKHRPKLCIHKEISLNDVDSIVTGKDK